MNVEAEIDGYYCPKINSRWKSYNQYKLILWAWMMNEFTIVFTPTEVSHNGFYAHAAIQAASVILLGIPLAYSEICLSQYSNCNVFTVWDFFPLLRNVGYATYYLIFTKAVYLLVLTSWHLIYIFYASTVTPPWLSCNDFDGAKCMVKRVNVSVFQHCLEAQFLFEQDCGVKTASNCFYEREIGNNCTLIDPECYRPWKASVAVCTICLSVYVVTIKRDKRIQLVVRLLVYYVGIIMLVLFCISVSTSGTWYATKINLNWTSYNFYSCFNSVSRGFLSVGTGTGILIYLSRDVSFRSPATMTAISTCLFSLFVSFMFSLIAFSGIKTMSYYHGEEENIIEIGDSLFFPIFASMSEILIYFNFYSFSAIAWFSVGFLCLLVNFLIMYLFLSDSLLKSYDILNRYSKISTMIFMIFIIMCTLPFLCADLTAVITDAIEIMQTFNSLLFSISLYWIYGIRKHNIDIIFMIGIKANYFWKLTWFLSPITLSVILYRASKILKHRESHNSYYIKSLHICYDLLVLYIILGIYVFIILFGTLMQLLKYFIYREFHNILKPTKNWGPKDKILYRSRNMFLPEIMTREFLYRQVRISGYERKSTCDKNRIVEKKQSEDTVEEVTWHTLSFN